MSQMPPSPRRRRDYLLLWAKGVGVGSAIVVPGVSGGTIALVTGIYDELIESIRTFGRPAFLGALMRFRVRDACTHLNGRFLLAVGLGVLGAAFTLARVIAWLLTHQPISVWSFFGGLILASVIPVGRRVKRRRASVLGPLLIGLVGAYLLVGVVPAVTPHTLPFIFLSGFISTCAMLLPGISGALVLILLGKYEFMLRALSQRDWLVLGVFALGAVVAGVSFAQLLGWLLRRYHDVTIALLTGIMLGSLRSVWPFKSVDGLENVVPPLFTPAGLNVNVVYAALMALLGVALVLLLDHVSRRVR